MNKYIIVLIFISASMVLLTSCPEDGGKYELAATIKLKNNSLKSIIYLDWNSNNANDTLLQEREIIWDKNQYKINPGSFIDHNIRRYELPDYGYTELLSFYFFDPDTLELVPWERIAKENIILKRVDFHSWQELEDYNFEIAYP